MNIEWLSRICIVNDIRPVCTEPYSIIVDDRKYAVATDGHVLCAIETDNDYPAFPQLTFDTAEKILRFDGHYCLTTIKALREWVGNPITACSKCQSIGYIPCLLGHADDVEAIECHTCDEEGDIVCPDCNGYSDKRQHPRPGLINNVLIDTRLINVAIHHLRVDPVKVMTTDEDNLVYFTSGNVRIAVMPLRKSHSQIKVDDAITFNQWQHDTVVNE